MVDHRLPEGWIARVGALSGASWAVTAEGAVAQLRGLLFVDGHAD